MYRHADPHGEANSPEDAALTPTLFNEQSTNFSSMSDFGDGAGLADQSDSVRLYTSIPQISLPPSPRQMPDELAAQLSQQLLAASTDPALQSTFSQEEIDSLLEAIQNPSIDTSHTPSPSVNFSLPFDRRYQPSSSSPPLSASDRLQAARSSLQGQAAVSPRRRPMSFAGIPSGTDADIALAQLRAVAEPQWQAFRQRSSSSLTMSSDTDMDVDREAELELGSPGALSSEASVSPSIATLPLASDLELMRILMQSGAAAPRLQGLPEEMDDPGSFSLSSSVASDQSQNPSALLSELSISSESSSADRLTRRPSNGSNHSISPVEVNTGPHRRPLRRGHTGNTTAPASLSPRSAMNMRVTTSQQPSSLLSHLALARRRSPVSAMQPILIPSQSLPPPPATSQTSDNSDGQDFFDQASQRWFRARKFEAINTEHRRHSASGPTQNLADTSRQDSSFDEGPSSTTYDSWLTDFSSSMQRAHHQSGFETPLSSPGTSSQGVASTHKDSLAYGSGRMQPPKSAREDRSFFADSADLSSDQFSRATTWPRARPLSMIVPPTHLNSTPSESGRSFGGAFDVQTPQPRPVSSMTQYADRPPPASNSRARAGTVSGAPQDHRRGSGSLDRYDEVRAALDTLRRFVAQSQSPQVPATNERSVSSMSRASSFPIRVPSPSTSVRSSATDQPRRTLRHPPKGPLPPRGQVRTASRETAAHEERMRVLHDVSERIRDLKQRSEEYLRSRRDQPP